jgi:molecular chaperone DnaK
MVQDAEVHADEDKRKKERIEAHNHLDSLIYSTEKSLKEYGASLEASTKTHIEEAITKAKKALDSEDVTELKRTADELTQASHKLAEAVYAKQTPNEPGTQGASGGSAAQDKGEENVTDADFEELH